MSKNSGVLITGGAGFIGSHLAEKFLSQGVPVACVDNFCTGMKDNAAYLSKKFPSSLFQFFEADVTLPWSSWSSKLNFKPQYIFHMASPASPPLYQEMALETMWVNSIGLQNAMEFADQMKARVIFASTSEVYGDPDISPQPESFWGNVNSFGIRACYDESKRFGEALIYTWNRKKNTEHGLVRIFNTYGPRMNPADGRVVINFLVQALQGESLTVYGSGKQTRSFCYVDDLVEGLCRYADSRLTHPVNLGNDREFTILSLAETVQKIFPDKKLAIEFRELPEDDPKQRRPDLTLARKLLAPWDPKISLADGLRKMVDWLATTQTRSK